MFTRCMNDLVLFFQSNTLGPKSEYTSAFWEMELGCILRYKCSISELQRRFAHWASAFKIDFDIA
jgi:hypothetical protein